MLRSTSISPGLAALLALALGLAAPATESPVVISPPATEAPPAPPAPPSDLNRFGAFLDQHPVIEARLRENPGILADEPFLRNHPHVVQFLGRYPNLNKELAAHPRWFLHRALAREAGEPLSHEQLAAFDRFLDERPALARALQSHPGLIQHSEFVGKNPGLHEFMRRRGEGRR